MARGLLTDADRDMRETRADISPDLPILAMSGVGTSVPLEPRPAERGDSQEFPGGGR